VLHGSPPLLSRYALDAEPSSLERGNPRRFELLAGPDAPGGVFSFPKYGVSPAGSCATSMSARVRGSTKR
jgi:hypothetical protein